MASSIRPVVLRHIMIPAVMPLFFFIIAGTPVHVLGCRTRGLIALLTALVSGFAALAIAVIFLQARLRGDANAVWWSASLLILIIPVIALLILA